MFERLQRRRDARRLRSTRIPWPLWQAAVRAAPLLVRVAPRDRWRLRALAGRFLRDKTISGARGLAPDDFSRVFIAAQACLPVLRLGLDWYRGWTEVIVYPDTFVVERDEYDAGGVVHRSRRALAGESWDRGPVILSWADAHPAQGHRQPGSNVILHEFAHKLDLLNGAANGMPPLHSGMSRREWTETFSAAYAQLCRQLERGQHTPLDPYAGEGPAEFFAVASEEFFEDPVHLQRAYPAVYDQLSRFYRQDPLTGSA